MERRHIPVQHELPGYDALQSERYLAQHSLRQVIEFQPSKAYDRYHRMHKVLVGKSGAQELREIHKDLAESELPDYLDVAGWSLAEAVLADDSVSAVDRMADLDDVEMCWRNALELQCELNASSQEGLIEDSRAFRIALSIAYVPMLRALVAGNVTEKTREQVFVDILALASTAGAQAWLAAKEGRFEDASDFTGFEHEANAHLALLHLDDPRHIPLPSTPRGGSGYDHPRQTHDLIVVNQHYGKILKIVPIEVKARASVGDVRRYEALIVRGKMHLAADNRHAPNYTREAFVAFYEGTASRQQAKTVYQVSSTMKHLLKRYQMGRRDTSRDTITLFHDRDELMRFHPELSPDRPNKYPT